MILACWHLRHWRAQFDTSSLIEGQTTLEQIDCLVLSIPGWPNPCMTSNMGFRNEKGMKGLATPLLMSTMILRWPMSMDFRFKPEFGSLLSLLRSGSRGCCVAMACQSTPKSPMALTTHWRSAREASSRSEGVVEDRGVGGLALEFELRSFVRSRLTRELGGALASASFEVEGGMELWSTVLMSDSLSFGRERASATTLALPFKYRISVVYSEIHAS